MENTWRYRHDIGLEHDFVGYDVEATDGHIGRVDEALRDEETDNSHLVVDTGLWIFGKKRVIPAGVVTRVDSDHKTLYVNMTKDQVKDAPDWHDKWFDHIAARDIFGTYYGPFGW